MNNFIYCSSKSKTILPQYSLVDNPLWAVVSRKIKFFFNFQSVNDKKKYVWRREKTKKNSVFALCFICPEALLIRCQLLKVAHTSLARRRTYGTAKN